jgi:hypothetical protein
MTPIEEASRMQQRLARAMASGAFEEAARLLGPYSSQVERAIQELSPANASELAARVLEFYHWAIFQTRASRAHACAQLRELAAPSPYRTTPTPSRQHWQYDA